jgi:uncharacterized protein (TIGR04255 family)
VVSVPRVPRLPNDPITFADPPVNEVILGVQYSSRVADDAVALAAFWPLIREDFPGLAKQPALPPAIETFTSEPAFQQPIQFIQGQPDTRYWFSSRDDTRLIQVQPDRFIVNWRERSDQYPRYRTLRREFCEHYERFLESLPTGADASVDLCEVTYINHIEAAKKGVLHRPLGEILRLAREVGGVLPRSEDTTLQERYVLADAASESPNGRLYITAVPGFRQADQAPIYVVTMMVRVRPGGTDLRDIVSCFDAARDLIVRGFKDITTPAMHKLWGLRPE